ncbi:MULTISPECIES: lysophospholipid acyltransferase family protein [Acinetobacter]|uniref:Putative HtrB protein n=1 Tax=Acinetobacter baylyi (strain ATCC 33305 / BD413 / ADP1) TaxID=62977 RepID=Q9EYM0_ACIAD|nr:MULTISPECIES: lysophospholipid acyltransferase family protein [Acinetobacter]AAG34711.1 putative HtrB protein [Acinetobacter baylyi ADP1]KAF2370680.1 lipid A biosynthesis acyltransferase [Acinetobacter baylyi]KAF2375181.1 lipid A biosynthesis acyltransferase [Acinetobacter baylyi]KAF2378526.1 lipid A biosynthesis acyltransferase [Acinetobacter baylyi]KAF2379980.1 lipid A biosynthesis acyltransferase [Acinetobacter baylyi]
MTTSDSRSFMYRLLKFISRQPIQLSRLFARMLAGLVNTLKLTKTSRTIQLNLKITLPYLNDQQRERIIQNAIRNELTSYMEFFSIWGSSNQKNISRIHHVEGADFFHQAIAENKGIVLIVPHFGTWEIMNAWCAQYTDMTILYKPVKDKDADRFVREARSREQAKLVPTDESGVRQIFKALKQGGTTVILPDHTPNVGGEMVDYFGIPLASSNLSAKLIQKTKAKALFLYAIRNENHGFDMFIEPMDPAIYQGTDHDGTLVIHHAIEDLIRKYPDHYHWSYKRFKANPELDNLYTLNEEDALANVEQVRQANRERLNAATTYTTDDKILSAHSLNQT